MGETKKWAHKRDEEGNLVRVDYDDGPEPTEMEKFDSHVKKLNKRIYGD